MKKALSDMSLEELRKLFPIVLTEHKEIRAEWYAEEEKRLRTILPLGNIKVPKIKGSGD